LAQFVVIGEIALWVVVITSLVSAADYFRRFSSILSPKLTDVSASSTSSAANHQASRKIS
jgi:hypothetical protein